MSQPNLEYHPQVVDAVYARNSMALWFMDKDGVVCRVCAALVVQTRPMGPPKTYAERVLHLVEDDKAVAVLRGHDIHVLDGNLLHTLRTISLPPRPVKRLCMTPSSEYAVVVGEANNTTLVTCAAGRVGLSISLPVAPLDLVHPRLVAVSSCSRYIITTEPCQIVVRLAALNPAVVASLPVQDLPLCMICSVTGTWVALGFQSGRIVQWNWVKGVVASGGAITSAVVALKYSAANARLAALGADNVIRQWDVSTGTSYASYYVPVVVRHKLMYTYDRRLVVLQETPVLSLQMASFWRVNLVLVVLVALALLPVLVLLALVVLLVVLVALLVSLALLPVLALVVLLALLVVLLVVLVALVVVLVLPVLVVVVLALLPVLPALLARVPLMLQVLSVLLALLALLVLLAQVPLMLQVLPVLRKCTTRRKAHKRQRILSTSVN